MEGNFDQREIIAVTQVENLLKEKFETKWKNDVLMKPKLRTYCKFKETFQTEQYVKFNLNRRERSLTAQYRLGILPIHVETGRYRGTPLEERFCFHCKDKVEDEIHLLLDCPLYSFQRCNLFQTVKLTLPYFENCTIEQKLCILLNEFWKECGKYISLVWEIRTLACIVIRWGLNIHILCMFCI